MVADLGSADLNFDVPLSAQNCLGSMKFGRSGWAAKQDDGTSQIKVNPTKVRDHQCHPVTTFTVLTFLHVSLRHGEVGRSMENADWLCVNSSRWNENIIQIWSTVSFLLVTLSQNVIGISCFAEWEGWWR